MTNLGPDHVLLLRAPFEPVPLYRALGKRGFAHYTEQCAADAVPGLAELTWPAAEALAFLGLTVGVATLAVGVVTSDAETIRAATLVVLVGAVSFAATLGAMLHHLLPCPLRAAPRPS